jgi:hypothetical protein
VLHVAVHEQPHAGERHRLGHHAHELLLGVAQVARQDREADALERREELAEARVAAERDVRPLRVLLQPMRLDPAARGASRAERRVG